MRSGIATGVPRVFYPTPSGLGAYGHRRIQTAASLPAPANRELLRATAPGETGSDDGFWLGRGEKTARARVDVNALAVNLRENEVLDQDAGEAEYLELARSVADDFRSAEADVVMCDVD